MVVSTLLWTLLGVSSLASDDIKESVSCVYEAEPEITAPAKVAKITKYNIAELCPLESNGGSLHNGACGQCAAKGDKANGKFVFCNGCNNSKGASCQEVLAYIFATEASTWFNPNLSTSQTWTTSNWHQVTTTTERPTTPKAYGKVSANCAIPAESSLNQVKTPQITKFSCDGCFNPVANLRTPALEIGCCDTCLKFAQNSVKNTQKASNIIPFVYCSGCDATDKYIFKSKKYEGVTEKGARAEAEAYLKTGAVACKGLPSDTGPSSGTIRKAVVMVSMHVLAACAVLEW